MNTLHDVKMAARAIVGDQDGDWMTDAYLDPMANHCYQLIILDLSDTCSPYITKVATIPNLPVGTTELSKYQNDPNQPLYGLIDVFREGVDQKRTGTPDTCYCPVRQTDKLPNYAPPGSPNNIPASMCFEWRAYVLYITPMPIAIDLRVRGEFRPAPLVKEDDALAIHPLMGSALAEQVAACSMRERANQEQMQSFSLVGSEALDNIKNQLVRSQQGTTVRLGRMNGGRRGWGRGYYGSGSF